MFVSDTLGPTCKLLIQTKRANKATTKQNKKQTKTGKVGARLKNVKEMQLMFMANFGSKK